MSIVKPPRLRRGDVIGLVSPASPPLGRDRLERGIRYLEGLGYRVEVGAHVEARHGYLAGTDEQRLADLNGMLRNPRVAAVFAVRGGYGSARLLSGVDYAAVRRHPKVLVGYSDLTALQLALHRKTGLVTFSGPMVASDFGADPDPFAEEHFWRLLTSTRRAGRLPGRLDRVGEGVRPGVGEGRLLGGNLSLFVSLLGTPFLPAPDGRWLVFEDVGEHFYRIDRLLNQLRLAGVLRRSQGVILGRFTGCTTPRPGDPHLPLATIFQELLGRGDLEAFAGLDYGHVPRKLTLPWGVLARVDRKSCSLVLGEAAVS